MKHRTGPKNIRGRKWPNSPAYKWPIHYPRGGYGPTTLPWPHVQPRGEIHNFNPPHWTTNPPKQPHWTPKNNSRGLPLPLHTTGRPGDPSNHGYGPIILTWQGWNTQLFIYIPHRPLSGSVSGSPVRWGVWSIMSPSIFGSGAVFRWTAANRLPRT